MSPLRCSGGLNTDQENLSIVVSACAIEHQDLLDSKSFTVKCRLTNRNDVFNYLLDSGSSTFGFINRSVVQNLNLPLSPLPSVKLLNVADGASTRQVITHTTIVDIAVGDHSEKSLCYVIDMHYDLILGMPWWTTYNPKVNWKTRAITFDSSFCQHNCSKKAPFISIGNNNPPNNFTPSPSPVNASPISSSDYDTFMNTDKYIPFDRIKSMLPKQFNDFADMFLRKEADSLSSFRPGKDHEIKPRNGATPPFKRSYAMSTDEMSTVKKYIDENLEKGIIRPSSSPYSAPVLLVKKQSGCIRVCVDYLALNDITIKNRHPITLVSKTMDRLSRAKYFTTLDVISAFNRIRIKPGHEEKTAFNTRYGQFEYLVMPFGLCNAPGSFQSLINDFIHDYLDNFATAYLDDILIYSESLEDHISHVRKVLDRMRSNNLQLDIQKCCFCTTKVKYLGLWITTDGLCMDLDKIKAITSWQTPSNLKDVRSFLGFANFYRRFIKNFSEIVTPLTNLTKSSSKIGTKQKNPFHWNDQCQLSFEKLKTAFTSAPILTHFEQGRETWVETDASDYVTAATLSQMVGILKPVTFLSKKLSPQECNYDTYDKELLSIIRAFETWRPELISTTFFIKSPNPSPDLTRLFTLDVQRLPIADSDPIVQELIELTKIDSQKLPNHLKNIQIPLNDLQFKNDKLHHHDRLYIPDDGDLRTLIIKDHDTSVTGHGGRCATYFLILRKYFWPTMLRDVETFVKSCHTCIRAKPFQTKYQVQEVASTFRRFVIAYDAYTETIVSDRGPQWTSGFWKCLLSRMGTKIKFISAHHPESDGQSENAVKFLKQYLRIFFNYDENNWVDLLPEAQLAALNHPNESTGLTLFFIDRGHHPNVTIHPPVLFSQGPAKMQQQVADNIYDRVKNIQEHVQKSLLWAQAKQAQFSNSRRQQSPAYKV
ncbi:hypothetical protein EPUL_004189, partial [Erysiphe pulchra]